MDPFEGKGREESKVDDSPQTDGTSGSENTSGKDENNGLVAAPRDASPGPCTSTAVQQGALEFRTPASSTKRQALGSPKMPVTRTSTTLSSEPAKHKEPKRNELDKGPKESPPAN